MKSVFEGKKFLQTSMYGTGQRLLTTQGDRKSEFLTQFLLT